MKKNVEPIVSMGSLWDSVEEYVEKAKVEQYKRKNKIEQENKEIIVMNRDNVSYQMVTDNREEINKLLKKAGISPKLYFPFATITNDQGELEFIPKNIFKMKKDSAKCKEQLQKALEEKKITPEEFEQLNENLDEMLKENGLEEQEEEKVPDEEEVNELYEAFQRAIEENIEGLIASIGEKSFDKMCEDYEEMELDERKNGLEKMNSAINKKLGIAGKLKFSTDPNLTFENSFIKGGYMLSEKDVGEKGLKETLHDMMERSMFRKLQTKPNQNLSNSQRAALAEKIKIEKKVQEEKARNEEIARQKQVQRARKMFN